jgi:hypothetical protein
MFKRSLEDKRKGFFARLTTGRKWQLFPGSEVPVHLELCCGDMTLLGC